MIVAFTGHRPQKLGGQDKGHPLNLAIRQRLDEEIITLASQGVTQFISGMAHGVDLWAVDSVYRVSNALKIPLQVVAALPFPGQEEKWNKQDKEEYHRLLLGVADSRRHMISPQYHQGALYERNYWMVDHADLVLAVWNGLEKGGTWHTISYARRVGKPVKIISVQEVEGQQTWI